MGKQIFYGEFDGRRPKRLLVKVIGNIMIGSCVSDSLRQRFELEAFFVILGMVNI